MTGVAVNGNTSEQLQKQIKSGFEELKAEVKNELVNNNQALL